MIKRTKLEQAIASRQSTIDKLIGRNKNDKKELQAVIDKKKEPEFDYSKSIVATKNGEMYLLVPTRRPESYEIVGYDWLNLKTGQANSCSCWKTQRKAIDCYSDHVIKNVDLAIIGDQAKQAKVGEKSEQGKSELKTKDEPKLRHGDYGPDSIGDMTIMLISNHDNSHKLVRASLAKNGSLQVMNHRTDYLVKTVLGNLCDDLTETSEGFEMKWSAEATDGYGNIKCKVKDNGIWLHINTDSAVFGLEQIEELRRKLGHVLNHGRGKT